MTRQLNIDASPFLRLSVDLPASIPSFPALGTGTMHRFSRVIVGSVQTIYLDACSSVIFRTPPWPVTSSLHVN